MATKATTTATAGLPVARAATTNDTSNHFANSALNVTKNAHDDNIDHHIQQSTHDTLAHCMLRSISLELSTWTYVETVQLLDLSAIGPKMPDMVFVGQIASKFTPNQIAHQVALAEGKNLHAAFGEHFALFLLAHWIQERKNVSFLARANLFAAIDKLINGNKTEVIGWKRINLQDLWS